jgi:desulfoferrodoxin (superoxide reductase-like protein)
MPAIAMFYGIIVYLYFQDNKRHHLPHIHAEYQDQEVIVAIENGAVLDGALPPSKMKLLLAWIELRKEELMADWSLAVAGKPVFKIDPLR